MSLALNKPKLDNLADEIWKSAQRLRGKFKPYEYQNIVLPSDSVGCSTITTEKRRDFGTIQ